MPNYQFLLHNSNTNTLNEWEVIPNLNAAAISSIDDKFTDANSRAKIGTSIPTPLAGMYACQTAFKIMNQEYQKVWAITDLEQKRNQLKKIEQSIYGGQVSDCLDLLEWLYTTTDRTKFTFENIVLNNEFNFNKPVTDQENTRNLLAFNSAIKQAACTEKFGNKIELNLIIYNNNSERILVGGSSPMTLVFLSPNFKDNVKRENSPFNNLHGFTSDVLFDNLSEDCYCALYNRHPKFIAYLKSIVNSINVPSPLDDFKNYVNDAFEKKSAFEELMGRSAVSMPTFLQTITANNAQENRLIDIRILENSLLTLSHSGGIETFESDFVLDISRCEITDAELSVIMGTDKKPLILSSTCDWGTSYTRRGDITDATQRFTRSFVYDTIRNVNQKAFNGNLDSTFSTRRLPIKNEVYPYITDEDIFYDYLIDMDFQMDDDRFETLNIPSDPNLNDQNRFLLPIKPLVIQLLGNNLNLSTNYSNNSVTISIQIPVLDSQHQRSVEFRRTYCLDIPEKIHKASFDLAIMPFFRMQTGELNNFPKYLVFLEKTGSESSGAINYSGIKLIEKGTICNTQASNRASYDLLNINTSYVKTTKDYKAISLSIIIGGSPYYGMLIPRFPIQSNTNAKYRFAIDFGTTNTHIEYSKIGEDGRHIANTIRAYEHKDEASNAPFIVLLNKMFHNANPLNFNLYRKKGLEKAYEIIIRECITPYLGCEIDYPDNTNNTINKIKYHSFPTRTAAQTFRRFQSDDTNPFIDTNIAFMIGENFISDDNSRGLSFNVIYSENLKWALENNRTATFHNRAVIKNYFDQLFHLILYKLLHDGCDIPSCEIVITRPISMSTKLHTDLKRIIERSLSECIPTFRVQNINFEISESIAPYHYFDAGVSDYYCNIDIGGGTSDIFVQYSDNTANQLIKKKIQASVKFAGNDLWGKPESKDESNGFIQMYKNWNEFNRSSDSIYIHKYNNFLSLSSDESAISYLFKNDSILKFSENIIQNSDFRLILLLHYASIVYGLTQIIGEPGNGIKLLQNSLTITFSGNASLYINSLFTSDSQRNYYTKFLFILMYNLNRKGFSEIGNTISSSPILRVEMNNNPKQITASGAIKAANYLQNHNQANAVEDRYNTNDVITNGMEQVMPNQDINNQTIDNVVNKYYLLSELPTDSNIAIIRQELVSSIFLVYNSILNQFRNKQGNKWIEDFGDLEIYKDILTEEKINQYVTAWINALSSNGGTLENEPLFFKPIPYLLYELSIAIFTKRKIS